MICPFKAGDVARSTEGRGFVVWFINDYQFVSIEFNTDWEREGHKGLYKSNSHKGLNWKGYEKICHISELKKALLGV